MALSFLPPPTINQQAARNVSMFVRVISAHTDALDDLSSTDAIAERAEDARHHLAAVRDWAERGLAELGE